MALDGMMLYLLRRELLEGLSQARVDKIYQPAKEELVFAKRSQQGNRKLLISVSAQSPRVNFTTLSIENPKQPPMFCMLMRKWLGNAKLIDIRQPGLERVLHFDFETTNELGDTVTVTLAVEIMGRYSNAILIGPDGRVIDSIK
ncbi:MAG: NFACT family protein, partial [Oscillospiraceae bacterium]|nr:NFACT family protein [Oscillospiraceae bacterium]